MNPHTLTSIKIITITNTGNHAKNADPKHNQTLFSHHTSALGYYTRVRRYRKAAKPTIIDQNGNPGIAESASFCSSVYAVSSSI